MENKKRLMKAYKAWSEDGEGSTVVFAETRNKAKLIALSCDCCDGADYIDIRVRRIKELDHLYKGRTEADWYDPDVRIILVRDFSWRCLDPYYAECEECPAEEFGIACEDMDGDENA